MTKQEIIAAYKDLQNKTEGLITRDKFVEETGISKHQVCNLFGSFSAFKDEMEGGATTSSMDTASTSGEVRMQRNHQGEVSVKSPIASTLDELIEKAQIDLQQWEIVDSSFNEWGNENNYNAQFKARIKPRFSVDLSKMGEFFAEQTKNYQPRSFNIEKIRGGGKNLLLLSIQDHHLGQLSWGRETGGANYDVNIACDLYREAAYSLVNRVNPEEVDKIVFLIGSDFFNTDTIDDTTTAGTRQESDGRWQRMFEKGCEIATEVIGELATRFQVETVYIPGNHDFQNSFFLAHYLHAFFRNHPNVNIDIDPRPRKYLKYGCNLLGFTHGSEEKHADLPLIMAQEARLDWATTKHAHFIMGHLHHQSVKEYHGVKVEIAPSLVSADSWHNKKGYIGNVKCSKSFLFDKDQGLVASYYYNAE